MSGFKYPVLTPTFGLGSYGRTASAILVGGPRSTIGNQKRIYAWYSARGQGQQYKDYLLNSLGPQRVTSGNQWPKIF
jgi:hypothetical protein